MLVLVAPAVQPHAKHAAAPVHLNNHNNAVAHKQPVQKRLPARPLQRRVQPSSPLKVRSPKLMYTVKCTVGSF